MLKLIKSPVPEKLEMPPVRRRRMMSAGRLIYLGLLILLALGLLHYAFGAFLFFEADGLVVRDRVAVATTYFARVTSVAVTEGQLVKEGDILLRLESTDMLERLADLSARRADLRTRRLDLMSRIETAEALLPIADRREREAAQILASLRSVESSGLVTSARYEQALRDDYEAREILVRLDSEYRAAKAHLEELSAALRMAEATAADLDAHYAGGLVRAPADGTVGAKVPSVGEVVRPGEICLSIHSGEVYVLAYLPQRYLLPIEPGMPVTVSSGRLWTRGIIAEILPISDALPQEFQNTFKPQDRKQLAKVRLTDERLFPIGEKVQISRRLRLGSD